MKTESHAPVSQVLGSLTRAVDLEHAGLLPVLERIAVTAANTLRVARVNIWVLHEEPDSLHCLACFDAVAGNATREPALLATAYPHYFDALQRLRNITAFDAATDPRTAELKQTYLQSRGIATLLDVPVLRSGKVVGVVCHEHVGAPREFDAEERAFAGSIGDLVALVLETNDRLKVERERARLSERIARMQQVERVGVLAGGLVHDFRNLLQIIAANVDMLRYELSSEKANRLLADVSLAIERANDLCTRLLSVQTEEPRRANEVDAAAVCREVVALLQPRVPAGAALEVVAEASGPTLLGDEAEVRQVLINLVLNALEAVAARPGPVTIRLAKHTPGKLTGMAADFRASAVECVLVEVEDAGVGIAPEQLQRIFEPFFTTKLDGHGFGLTSVMGVVRASGGAIQVDSEPGRGTLFRVWFPAGSGVEVPPAAL